MDVEIPCPQCGTVFRVRRELLGKRTKCTKCGAVFVLAAHAATPSAAEPARSPIPTSIFPEAQSTPHSQPTDIPSFVIDTGARPRESVRPSGEMFGFEHDPSKPRFPALRLVARAYEILAIIVLAFAALILLMFVIAVIREPRAILGAIVGSGFTFFAAVAASLTMLFMAQGIRLWLQVEQNTRETQQACRRLADHLCSVESDD
jgi:predicted Zn finger-like uncharacterized protein